MELHMSYRASTPTTTIFFHSPFPSSRLSHFSISLGPGLSLSISALSLSLSSSCSFTQAGTVTTTFSRAPQLTRSQRVGRSAIADHGAARARNTRSCRSPGGGGGGRGGGKGKGGEEGEGGEHKQRALHLSFFFFFSSAGKQTQRRAEKDRRRRRVARGESLTRTLVVGCGKWPAKRMGGAGCTCMDGGRRHLATRAASRNRQVSVRL